jgi:GT2 family glycosyltransferase
MTGAMPANADADVLVIVVAYRSDDHLAECLAVIAEEFSVTVVDNEAAVATRTIVESARASYLASADNIGFAAAVNLALRETWDGKRDVLLLNPDARLQPGDLNRLHAALHADPKLAAVGPRLTGAHGESQQADWPVPSPGQVWADALGLARRWRGRRFVVGAALLLRAEALASLGGLDERYFLYAEETDWQLRASRAGWSVAVVDSAIAVHVGGASSNDSQLRDRLFHASGEAFARRWYGSFGWQVVRLGSVVAAVRRSVVGSPAARRDGRRTLGIYLRGPLRVQPQFAKRAK